MTQSSTQPNTPSTTPGQAKPEVKPGVPLTDAEKKAQADKAADGNCSTKS